MPGSWENWLTWKHTYRKAWLFLGLEVHTYGKTWPFLGRQFFPRRVGSLWVTEKLGKQEVLALPCRRFLMTLIMA